MQNLLNKTATFAAGLLTIGAVHAHPGPHGADGMLSGIVHLLGEHGYLLILVLCVGAIALQRFGRV